MLEHARLPVEADEADRELVARVRHVLLLVLEEVLDEGELLVVGEALDGLLVRDAVPTEVGRPGELLELGDHLPEVLSSAEMVYARAGWRLGEDAAEAAEYGRHGWGGARFRQRFGHFL